MVEFINSWAQKIIIAVIICTIIEMILPEGKNKKYIRAVLGIYIVFNIISPIINNGKNIPLNFKFEYNQNNTIPTSLAIDTNKYIESVYIEKIKKDIENNLKEKNYNVDNIKIEIETEDESKYGSIISLDIQVSNAQEQDKSKINIDKIVIGEDRITSDDGEISNQEKESIKDFLSDNYGIDKKEIEVR